MTFERLAKTGPDYSPCRYGNSRLVFRGPRRPLRGSYVAFLGSTETYGKYVDTPFPDLVGQMADVSPLNLGCVNAGLDTFHDDPTVLDLVRGAQACVLQVMGAHKLTNRLYSVHARRNDRFVAASPHLRTLYPNADFAEVHFTRHLLCMLRDLDPGRFGIVREELSRAWIARMSSLIETVRVPVILLWISPRSPDESAESPEGPDPLFVTREMLAAIVGLTEGLVEIPYSGMPSGRQGPDMPCSEFDRLAAMRLPGPDAHRRIAAELSPRLRAWI